MGAKYPNFTDNIIKYLTFRKKRHEDWGELIVKIII